MSQLFEKHGTSKSMQVLIVETNPVQRDILLDTLHTLDHRTLTAENALDAWDILLQEPVDCLILNWALFGVDGLALVKRVRSSAPTRATMILLLVHPATLRDPVYSGLDKGDDYVTLPLDTDELRARLVLCETRIHRTALPAAALPYTRPALGAGDGQESCMEPEINFLASIVDSSDSAIIGKDLDGNILSWNKAAEKMYGYTANEVVGQNIRLLVPDEIPEDVTYILELVQQGERINHYRTTRRRKDGRLITVSLTVSPIRDQHGTIMGASAIAQDITEQEGLEHALHTSQQQYRSVVDTVKDVLCQTNVAGQWTFLNQAWTEITGYEVEECLGKQFFDFVHSDDRQHNIDQFQPLIERKKEMCHHVVRYTTRTGAVRWIEVHARLILDDDGEILGTSGSLHDVTERKLAEDRLRENQERFELIADGNRDGLWDWDVQTNEVYFSPRWKMMLGYRDDELANSFDIWLQLMHPDDRERVSGQVEAALSGQADPYETEFRMRHRDGSYRWILARASVARDDQGTPLRMAGSHSDITDRKQAELSLYRRDAILTAVGVAAEQFLGSAGLADGMQVVLGQLGQATGVSRVYVFANEIGIDEVPLVSQRYEWVAEGVSPQIDNPELQHLSYHETGLERWMEYLSQNVPLYGDVRDFPQGEREVLEPQDIISIVVVPIFVGAEWWGFIGFDECQNERVWTVSEIDVLKAAAGIIGAAMHRARSELALRESEQRFRDVINAAGEYIWETDAQGAYTFLSERVTRVLGYPVTELLDHSPFEFMPPDEATQVSAWFRAVVERQEPFRDLEHRSITATGQEVWQQISGVPMLDAGGQVVGYRGTGLDITGRKQAEAARQASEEQLRAFVSNAPVILFAIDTDGIFTLSEGTGLEKLGIAPGSVVGHSVFDLYADRPDILEDVQEALRGSSFNVMRDVDVLTFQIWYTPMYDSDGTLTGTIGVSVDVTERVRVEKALQEATRAAEAANRAKSEFLANMSHEIRTPLNAVTGMTGLLLDTELSAEQRDYAETVRTSSDALLSLINDILDFSKIDAGRMELEQQPFDLRDCVEEALDLVASQAVMKKLDLAYEFDASAPAMILGDVTRLRQVLANLLSNAVKFTRQGEVIVGVSSQHTGHENYRLDIAVRDTGIGIPGERMDRLFRSFSQVDSSTTRTYGGTGLGLVISKRLVELMGGHISVESTVGVGTTFTISLDVRAVEAPPRDYLRSVMPGMQNRTLMVVDDNATNRTILLRQAETWGMQVHTFASAAEAIAWLHNGQHCDLAILDMQMPGMDGMQLATRIRSDMGTSAPPLVLLSSLGMQPEWRNTSLFAAVLTKPIKAALLYTTLMHVLDGNAPLRLQPPSNTELDRQMSQRYPLRILVAEDNATNQKVVLRMLERLGYRADVVANGVEVLDALQRQTYDVVLMDVQMPEMDGVEATSRLRARTSALHQPWIVALTANALSGDREYYLESGMDDYASKPIRIHELRDVLVRAFENLDGTRAAASDISQPNHADTSVARLEVIPLVPDNSEIIDVSILDDIQTALGGDDSDALDDVVTSFLAETPELLTRLEQAVAAGQADDMSRLAHRIKGSSASLGALILPLRCQELEHIGSHGDVAEAPARLAQVLTEYRRFATALGAMYQNEHTDRQNGMNAGQLHNGKMALE